MEKQIQTSTTKANGEEITRLAFNENPYGVSPMVTKELRENIEMISQYPPLDNANLKEKIASITGFKPENIGLSAGSVTFIDIVIKNFLAEDENMVIPKISFIAYKILAERYRVQFKLAEMNNYGLDINAINNSLKKFLFKL